MSRCNILDPLPQNMDECHMEINIDIPSIDEGLKLEDIFKRLFGGVRYLTYNQEEEMIIIKKKIKSLEDLILIGEVYDERFHYNINMKTLNKALPSIREVNEMVGISNIKNAILDNVIYLLMNLHKENEMMHICITGNPGTGKTTLGRLMGKIYCELGFLSNGKFHFVKRSDLIGKWCGHTAKNTKEAFKDARGGVLFIDEAYSLGNKDHGDVFTKECIDTINQCLSEYSDDVLCIIAGYKDDLDNCFFSYNSGLQRRFPFRYHIDDYDIAEIREIFKMKVIKDGWKIKDSSIPLELFEENKDIFKNNGGDCDTLLMKCKMAKARRDFGMGKIIRKSRRNKRHLVKKDVKRGMGMLRNVIKDKKEEEDKMRYLSMYM